MNKLKIVKLKKIPMEEYRFSYNRINIFVDEDRPINKGMQNIVEDIMWRRTHKAPKGLKPLIVEALKKFLVKHNFNNYSLKYDRYAGCSMCPCSPGFVLKDKENKSSYKKYNVWMKFE